MRPVEGEGRASFERELRAHHALLSELRDVPDVLHSEQMAVAFLVEDRKREAPADWQEQIAALQTELRGAREREGIPGMSWRLAQEVHERYRAFLERCLASEQLAVRRENLGALQAGIDRDFSTRRAAHDAKQRVPIGSVILEHVPQWFAQA